MSKDNTIYAQLTNPILVRKTILESAIKTAEILKGYERVKKLKLEKKAAIANLGKTISQLSALTEKLNDQDLPKTPKEPKPREPKIRSLKEEVEKNIKKAERLEPKEPSELHKLDLDIKELERKLKSL